MILPKQKYRRDNPAVQNPFSSFWMAGYECADQLNAFGNRVDLLQTTGHLQLLEEDYRQLNPFHIKTVREGIRWSQVEKKPYQYDWSMVETMIRKGKQCNIQQVWDICHFGYPDDITPVHPHFVKRFSSLCRAFVRFYRSIDAENPLIVTPINEVSFLSWLGGDAGGTSPYCLRMGVEVKYHLVRAYIEGIHAMKEEDPSVRILTTEPLIHIVPPPGATKWEKAKAATQHRNQFQTLDMLCGRMAPELGGTPDNLDILGYNFYYNNQWTLGFSNLLSWDNSDNDPRWAPLSRLLLEAYYRYNRPFVLSETSHPGIDRPRWMHYISEQVNIVLQQKVPFWGICLYPIIDRPDWDHLTPWHHAGLWDAELKEGELPKRVLYQPYAEALLQAQSSLDTTIKNLSRQQPDVTGA